MDEDLAAMVDAAVDEKAVIHHQVDRIDHMLELFMASHYGSLTDNFPATDRTAISRAASPRASR